MGRNIAALSGAALVVLLAAPATADTRGPVGGQFILAQNDGELSEECRGLSREERRQRQDCRRGNRQEDNAGDAEQTDEGEKRRRVRREEGQQNEEPQQEDNAGNAEENDDGKSRRRVRREEGQQSEEPQQEDNAANAEENDDGQKRRRVRREEGQQSEEQPELSEREQRLQERRARQQAEQEQRERQELESQQAQTNEQQERLRRLEEERQRELKEAEERRENRNDRRKRELTDQEQDRSERAKRITGQKEDEGRDRRARRLEAIEGGEVSQEERRERRRVRREFTDDTLRDVKRARKERREGDFVIIEEPDNRRIIREGRRVRIEEDDSDRLRGGRDVKTERGPRGRTRNVITRRNGVQIITVRNEEGDIVRRIKRLENGREVVLFSNEPKRKRRSRRGDGDGFSFFIDLPDFRVERSRRDYYLYADVADEEEMYDVLSGEPLEEFEEDYTLEEIRYSPDIRARLRKLNINTVNFDFGSWEIREDQFDKLEVVARVINRIIEADESEVFLIGGHTDLVGSEEDNLSLAGRRAETVARILTDEFGVPPENLVTQGYGESDPLVDTTQAEAANRRVEFMRITPALAQNEE